MDKFGIFNLFNGLFNKNDCKSRTVFGDFRENGKDGKTNDGKTVENGTKNPFGFADKNDVSSLLKGLLSSLSQKNDSINASFRQPEPSGSPRPTDNSSKMPPLKNLEKAATCHDEFVKRVMTKNNTLPSGRK